jgi:small neutral amino acid transporter SnatA (MarC family)
MSYSFASATVLLLLITDPVGNIPIFANALKAVAPARRRRVILREVLIAFGLLLGFMFAGDGFLRVMNLSPLSLQMAGGVVLFLIALRMVFPPPPAPVEPTAAEPLIVPLAIPALAGPSALATVMLRLFSRMMVMACETRLRMVAYWKPPTSERRGRRDFAEDAESKKIHRFSLRPLRILGVLCVWLFIFLMRRVAVRH